MLTLFHAPDSRSVRTVWLLEELGLGYQLEVFKLGEKLMREPQYVAVNPNGRVPTLVHQTENGPVTVHESGAIVEYVLDRLVPGSGLKPAIHDPLYPEYLQWLHYCEGMLGPQINLIVVEAVFLPPEKKSEVHEQRARRLLGKMLHAVEQQLEGREYINGAFSGADTLIGHACVVAKRLGADIAQMPNVAAYIDRCQARPALQAAWAAGVEK